MTIQTFLAQRTAELAEAGIESARLDVLLLLEDCLGIDRAILLAHPERPLSPTALRVLNKKCTQRKQHVPLAYLTQRAFFCGRQLYVDHHVLVPRPESEAMISLLLELPLPDKVRIADVGTGSGCLAVSAALDIPDAHVYACDISPAALAVAKRNASDLSAQHVSFHQTDLLDGCPVQPDVILANLPYVPDDYPVNQAATHEPHVALYGGADGLDAYRKLWQQITSLPGQRPQYVITEALQTQHQGLADLAGAAGYTLGQTRGLAQLFTLFASRGPAPAGAAVSAQDANRNS